MPDPLKYASPTRADGFSASTVEPGARSDTQRDAGRDEVGLAVTATGEGRHGVVGDGAAVPWTSAAPTVITNGSSPGFEIVVGIVAGRDDDGQARPRHARSTA